SCSFVNRGFKGSIWLGAPGARWMTRKETTEIRNRLHSLRQHARRRNGSTVYPALSSGRNGGSHRARGLWPSLEWDIERAEAVRLEWQVLGRPARSAHLADDLAVQEHQAPADVEKRVRLVVRDEAMELARHGRLARVVVLAANALHELVRPGVRVPHEVQLLRARLARVEDLVDVGVEPHRPAEHDRVEIELVHPLADEDRPFQGQDLDLDPEAPPSVLDDHHDRLALVVPGVRDEGELERLPVLLENPLRVLPPARLRE